MMNSNIFKNLKPVNQQIKKTKGFTQKTVDIVNTKSQPINLKQIKELTKIFQEESKKNDGKFIIRGRNKYHGNVTIRSYDGSFYDEDDDYYNARGYEREVFDDFEYLQIVYIN
jgi:hypothetical protein